MNANLANEMFIVAIAVKRRNKVFDCTEKRKVKMKSPEKIKPLEEKQKCRNE
jgi:hypothetical protein